MYAGVDWHQRITVDQRVLAGKPIVRGTRLSVEFILGLLSSGWKDEQILENYPTLTVEDVRACLAYARWVVEGERVFEVRA